MAQHLTGIRDFTIGILNLASEVLFFQKTIELERRLHHPFTSEKLYSGKLNLTEFSHSHKILSTQIVSLTFLQMTSGPTSPLLVSFIGLTSE